MSSASVNIVGAGRLGQSLGRLLADSGCYRIAGVLSAHPESSARAVAFIGQGEAVGTLAALPAADYTLLSVPDGAIAGLAEVLACEARFEANALVFHASGAGELDLLAPLAECGIAVGCLHPAYSFAEPARAVAGFVGTPCALDGDEVVCARLAALATAIGGRPFRLAAGGKAAYHAALSVASNYLVTLTELAGQLARQAGVPDENVAGLIGPLMRQTLENALMLGPAAALTGPIVRGDAGTVARHLAVLPDDAQAAYRRLGERTVTLAAGRLDAAQRGALLAMLRD
ncbi:DUF2520 domain-containing protein [Crenobacter sp. SG2303]|uniref:DUF2520 domain-containing protein n=1 Tax=Crenobacter oryzisoli TaxID=3056844 RepID=A0ABT7XNZ9_9NEIS|nr:Rossmann-like and DUF2520 domain-containing protein [Crenobacter sp. SG2303]MDN0075526.1 DUF2520 domain-containing protein [Crenobacter sp. SG2303]